MEKREQRKKRAVALVCLGLFVAFSLAVCWFVGKPMLQFVSQWTATAFGGGWPFWAWWPSR